MVGKICLFPRSIHMMSQYRLKQLLVFFRCRHFSNSIYLRIVIRASQLSKEMKSRRTNHFCRPLTTISQLKKATISGNRIRQMPPGHTKLNSKEKEIRSRREKICQIRGNLFYGSEIKVLIKSRRKAKWWKKM